MVFDYLIMILMNKKAGFCLVCFIFYFVFGFECEYNQKQVVMEEMNGSIYNNFVFLFEMSSESVAVSILGKHNSIFIDFIGLAIVLMLKSKIEKDRVFM
ncbi:hypothetical protein F0310_05625 (plasmid) [Borrelia sp. A-FGy1]|uniref:hypothetical protein n=1 Tax=Borrelia sp. A-FGy1 TaxID=2608247 RepID=UPI0015F39CDA|nr:hypothetical protein [Borrelia sp. A-FGy1]QMU99887.1 hypothetical protein F0310_05625 [Borrelia sp. A-FGy1]